MCGEKKKDRHKNSSLQEQRNSQTTGTVSSPRNRLLAPVPREQPAGRPSASQTLQGLLLPDSFFPKDQVTSFTLFNQ